MPIPYESTLTDSNKLQTVFSQYGIKIPNSLQAQVNPLI
jgi:hypothetical protein